MIFFNIVWILFTTVSVQGIIACLVHFASADFEMPNHRLPFDRENENVLNSVINMI